MHPGSMFLKWKPDQGLPVVRRPSEAPCGQVHIQNLYHVLRLPLTTSFALALRSLNGDQRKEGMWQGRESWANTHCFHLPVRNPFTEITPFLLFFLSHVFHFVVGGVIVNNMP